MLYRGFQQKALDIINPEFKSYTLLAMPSDYLLDYSPVRFLSVSSHTRYVAIAGTFGFSHVSTASSRWRTLDSLDPSSLIGNPEDIPHVRGGLCWHDNILLVAADFGESHEVRISYDSK